MARVELSQAADRDLNDIYIYSYREFGEAKAEAYLHALEQRFEQLAVFPGLGRSIRPHSAGLFPLPPCKPHGLLCEHSRRNPGSSASCISAWILSATCNEVSLRHCGRGQGPRAPALCRIDPTIGCLASRSRLG